MPEKPKPEVLDNIAAATVRIEGGVRWDGYGLDTLLWPVYFNRGYIEQRIKVDGITVFVQQLTDRFPVKRSSTRTKPNAGQG
jgi:hypothetical protein